MDFQGDRVGGAGFGCRPDPTSDSTINGMREGNCGDVVPIRSHLPGQGCHVTAGMCSWLSLTLAVWMAKKERLPGLSGGSQIPCLAARDP